MMRGLIKALTRWWRDLTNRSYFTTYSLGWDGGNWVYVAHREKFSSELNRKQRKEVARQWASVLVDGAKAAEEMNAVWKNPPLPSRFVDEQRDALPRPDSVPNFPTTIESAE